MKALSLFIVLLLAKAITLLGQDLPLSWWTVPAYLGQDAVVCLIFGVLEGTILKARTRLAWVLYGLLVSYAALNLPLMRLFASPLTLPMLQAAGQTIGDSILYYCTWSTLVGVGTVAVAGLVLPKILTRVPWRLSLLLTLAGVGLLLAALGPLASRRVETAGLYRNPFLTLLSSSRPRMTHRIGDAFHGRAFASPLHASPLSAWHGGASNRHVVVIILESTGSKYLAPYGATQDPMPNLTRLSHTSIQCRNAYAVYPESIKGLFTVLCSRYPAMDSSPTDYAEVRTPSIAQELKEAGYHTALFHSGRFGYLGMNSIIRQRGFDLLADAGTIGGNHESSFGIDEFATVERILSWVDTIPAEERFFLSYLPIAGHHPYETTQPGPFPEEDEIGRYLNALHEADAALGQLIAGFEQRGLATQTLFVVLGDHGEAFGQHQGNYGHTFFIYEENLRVPFFLIAPGLITEQVVFDWPMSLIDTAPTILGFIGRNAPTGYQGRSLFAEHSRRPLFYTDYSMALLGLRDGSWKYHYALDSGRSQLFDLGSDPTESRDVSAQHQAKVKAYRDELLRWSAAQRSLLSGRSPDLSESAQSAGL